MWCMPKPNTKLICTPLLSIPWICQPTRLYYIRLDATESNHKLHWCKFQHSTSVLMHQVTWPLYVKAHDHMWNLSTGNWRADDSNTSTTIILWKISVGPIILDTVRLLSKWLRLSSCTKNLKTRNRFNKNSIHVGWNCKEKLFWSINLAANCEEYRCSCD